MRRRARRVREIAGALLLVVALLAGALPGTALAVPQAVTPPAYADAAFKLVWERYDRPVFYGTATRSWTWAGSLGGAIQEPFKEGQDGKHLVQYYEKSRMEINDPNGDRTSPFFVTQGLLARDMIRGEVQTGVSTFEWRFPAEVPFGDPDDTAGPTYASLTGVLTAPPKPAGAPIAESIDRAGKVGTPTDPQATGVTSAGEVPGSGHSIASVFWDYLRQNGPVYDATTNQDEVEPLYDPTFYVTGLPITEAYWTRLKAGGVTKTVLLQCFERRCLTYTPTNDPAWRVEQGNTGLQYYRWRYETSDPEPYEPSKNQIAFTSLRDGVPHIYLMEPDGSHQRRLTGGGGSEIDPAWSPDHTRLAFTHEGFIFTVNADGGNLKQLVPAGRYQSSGDYHPAWSPDGKRIAFTRCKNPICDSDVWVMNADGTGATRLVAGSEPSWSPDGKRLVYASSMTVLPADRQLFTADADGGKAMPLTAAGPGYMPAWSPDGARIAFTSRRDGSFQVYTVAPDGSGARRLTPTGSDNYAPTWSSDGKRIAFASTRDRPAGNYSAVAVYVMNADGGAQQRLTNAEDSNAFPSWFR